MLQPNRTGFFNTVLWHLGLGNGEIPFLSDPALQLPSMIMIDVWKTTPFMALLLLAGLQLIPADIYEAADVDGAGPCAASSNSRCPCSKARLPWRWSSVRWMRCASLTSSRSCSVRPAISMASFTYYELIQNRAMGYSSASSMVIFVVLSIFAIGYMRSLGVKSDEH